MRLTIAIFLVIADCALASPYTDCIIVVAPPDDAVAPAPQGIVPVRGTTLSAGSVTLMLYPQQRQTTAVRTGSEWVAKVPVDFEVTSEVKITAPGCPPKAIFLTGLDPDRFPNRGHAHFGVEWTTDAEEAIHQVAVLTLASPPAQAEFLADVKRRLLAVAGKYLADFDITVDESPSTNRIQLVGSHSRGRYGWTEPPPENDCGDPQEEALVNVYAGSFRDDVRDRPREWTVLKTNDTPATRAEDIAHVLGAVLAHEVLHAVGLLQCAWMQGDSDWHNNAKLPLAGKKRFGNGLYLMDSFMIVLPPTLVGRSGPDDGQRDLLIQNTFSHSYVLTIHPRP